MWEYQRHLVFFYGAFSHADVQYSVLVNVGAIVPLVGDTLPTPAYLHPSTQTYASLDLKRSNIKLLPLLFLRTRRGQFLRSHIPAEEHIGHSTDLAHHQHSLPTSTNDVGYLRNICIYIYLTSGVILPPAVPLHTKKAIPWMGNTGQTPIGGVH